MSNMSALFAWQIYVGFESVSWYSSFYWKQMRTKILKWHW